MHLGNIFPTVSLVSHSHNFLSQRRSNSSHLIVASHVSRDLVLYDRPQHNPFQELIPMTREHPALLQIMIAMSALHMSNAFHKSSSATYFANYHPMGSIEYPCSTPSPSVQLESYNDALAAKQRALHLLKSTLKTATSLENDVTLAVVLLFIEFELIDKGEDSWKHHINGARAFIKTLCESNMSNHSAMTPLRCCLISNCLM